VERGQALGKYGRELMIGVRAMVDLARGGMMTLHLLKIGFL
jgi:hypothetical protein